jgi:hypothetical protein
MLPRFGSCSDRSIISPKMRLTFWFTSRGWRFGLSAMVPTFYASRSELQLPQGVIAEVSQESRSVDAQAACDLEHGGQARNLRASFHRAHEARREVCGLSKLLLRQSARLAQLPESFAKDARFHRHGWIEQPT